MKTLTFRVGDRSWDTFNSLASEMEGKRTKHCPNLKLPGTLRKSRNRRLADATEAPWLASGLQLGFEPSALTFNANLGRSQGVNPKLVEPLTTVNS